MFSRSFTSAVVAVSVLGLVGCGFKFGEKPKEKEVAAVASVSCMTESMTSFKKLFAGEASSNEVGEAVDCLQKVIISFKDNIRGQQKNAFTGPELARFLSDKVLKNKTQISPQFMGEFFKLKSALIGGEEIHITKDELTALSQLISRLKPGLMALAPHMKTLLGTAEMSRMSPELRSEALLNAKLSLQYFVSEITAVLEAQSRPYKLESLLGLAAEVVKMKGDSADQLQKLAQLGRLFVKAKMAVIGGNDHMVGDEWPRLGRLAVELFAQKLRLDYFAAPLPPEDRIGRLDVYRDMASDLTLALADAMGGASGKRHITNAEIADLLKEAQALLPKLSLSDALIEQVAKIKLVVVGPSPVGSRGWHSEDLKSLHEKVPRLFGAAKLIVQNLNQYKVDPTQSKKGLIKYEDFVQAEGVINSVIDRLSVEIRHGYSLTDLKVLIVELKPLIGDSFKLPENLEGLFGLAYAAKVALTGEQGPQLTIQNIQMLMKLGVRSYGHYVEFANFVKPFRPSEKKFIDQLEPLATKISGSAALLLELKASHKLTSEELTGVILAAQSAELLKTNIKRESLMNLFNGIWSHVLNTPEKRLEGQTSLTGFNAEALHNLGAELKLWMATQKAISAIFDKKPEYSKAEILAELQKQLDSVRDPAARLSLAELHRMVSANGNMNFNQLNFLKILAPDNGRYHAPDLVNSNIAKTISRIFLRAYITDSERLASMEGLTLEEIQGGFDQFKFVLYDLSLIDPSNAEFISGRFLEANTLLAVSNGDKMLNYEEFHHIILHTISGISRAKALEKLAAQQCLKLQNTVPMLNELDQECLLNLYNQAEEPFLGLPEFVKLRERARGGAEENKKYYLSLLMAAGHKLNPNQTVLSKDASLFPHVVQYVEAVYDRHDTNKDGELDLPEITVATPAFGFVINKVFGKIFDKPAKLKTGVLIYMLRCGESIKLTNTTVEKLGGFVRNPSCQNKQWSKTRSTRYNVGSLLGTLSVALRSDKSQEPQASSGPAGSGASAADSDNTRDDVFCNQEAPWQCFEQAQYYLDQYCKDEAIVPEDIPACPPPEEPIPEE